MKRLLSFFIKLGQIPSLVYAVIYLTTIPVFAVVYTLLPNNFYQATLRVETQYQGINFNNRNQLVATLIKGIQSSMRQNFIDEHGKTVVKVDKIAFDIDELVVDDIYFIETENKVVIKVHARADVEGQERSFSPVLYFYADEYSIQKGGSKEFAYLALDYHDLKGDQPFPVPLETAFPIQSGFYAYTINNHTISNRGHLRVNAALYYDLNAFVHNLNANPNYSEFIRMLYFSVVTITTLGFGDIVPVSSTARILVACESVIGVILIGLFLNSLSYQYQRTNNEVSWQDGDANESFGTTAATEERTL